MRRWTAGISNGPGTSFCFTLIERLAAGYDSDLHGGSSRAQGRNVAVHDIAQKEKRANSKTTVASMEPSRPVA
jgi:hypothetical protein